MIPAIMRLRSELRPSRWLRFRVWLAATAAAVALPAACGDEAASLRGTKLVDGRALANAVFTPHRQDHQLLYEAPIGPEPRWDLRTVPFAGGADRRLAADVVRGTRSWDAENRLYLLRRARPTDALTPDGQPPGVANLARISFADGATDEIPGVSTYLVDRDGRLVYLALPEGAAEATLHLRETDGTDRALGPASPFSLQRGRLLYVVGSDRVLWQITGPGATPMPLATGVESFLVTPGGTHVLLQLKDATGAAGASLVLGALSLTTLDTRPIPRSGICCQLGFSPDGKQAIHSDFMPPAGEGNLHFYDLATGTDRVVPVAAQAGGEIHQALFRPSDGPTEARTLILRDASFRLSIYRPGVDVMPAPLGQSGMGLAFAAGGRMLVYIQREVIDNQLSTALMSLDMEQPFAEPRRLTPSGANATGYFLLDGGARIGFWAHHRGELSDVYITEAAGGEARLVLSSVGPIAVSGRRIVGIGALSKQDGVGDLVQLDLATEDRRIIGRSVNDFALTAACPTCDPFGPGALVAYIVQTRVPSTLDGLWAATLE